VIPSGFLPVLRGISTSSCINDVLNRGPRIRKNGSYIGYRNECLAFIVERHFKGGSARRRHALSKESLLEPPIGVVGDVW
jgi:hypothetical protein